MVGRRWGGGERQWWAKRRGGSECGVQECVDVVRGGGEVVWWGGWRQVTCRAQFEAPPFSHTLRWNDREVDCHIPLQMSIWVHLNQFHYKGFWIVGIAEAIHFKHYNDVGGLFNSTAKRMGMVLRLRAKAGSS